MAIQKPLTAQGGQVQQLLSADLASPGVMVATPKTIAADVTLPAGYNASSVGPVTVADGVTVTLADDTNWRVL